VSDNGRFVFGHAVCICPLKLVKIKGKSSNSVRIGGVFLKKRLYMERGFIVDITNGTSQAQEVKLFAGSLPKGVMVTTMDNAYSFDALQMMARQNGFIGNSITTGFEAGLQIEIVNNVTVEKIILKGRYEAPEISINGTDEFVLVTCPPNSNFYIRLGMLPLE
jgi:hypothetical protein